MATKNLLDVFNTNKYELNNAAKQSKVWFQQQARELTRQNLTPQKVLKGDSVKQGIIIPGSLYMFLYDPKTKDELPYYDMFPLVFPYKRVKGGFMGLNMHYLPYQQRVQLLQRLMNYANNKKMDETTRLKYSWSLIGGVSRFKWAEPCLKHYLTSHVRSSFRKIEANDWATAMLLPVEQFVGANKNQVWAESLGY
jgi:hypothetical protein